MTRSILILAISTLVVSCSSPPDTGGYGQAYRGTVTGLKRTKNVAVYVARSEAERRNLEQQFLSRTNEWTLVGVTKTYGQYCDTAKIQELGQSNGADIACVCIGPTSSFKSKVSYGGYYPDTYQVDTYSPFIQPYQVPPPQGGLMESSMRIHEYNRKIRERNELKQIQDSKWTQVVVFLRRAGQ